MRYEHHNHWITELIVMIYGIAITNSHKDDNGILLIGISWDNWDLSKSPKVGMIRKQTCWDLNSYILPSGKVT